MKLKDIIGSMASKFAALALALVCAGNVWGAAEAKIGETPYESIGDAFTAAQAGDTITLLADVTPAFKSQSAITAASVIDLNGKTLNLTEDDLYWGTTTFKNGNIVVDPSVHPSTAVFWMFANQTLTFDDVTITATGVSGNYIIGLEGVNCNLNILNGSKIITDNASATSLTAVIAANGTPDAIVIEDSTADVKNVGTFILFGDDITIKGASDIALENIAKRGILVKAGATLSVEDTAKVTVSGTEPRDGGIYVADNTSKYIVADTATVTSTVTLPEGYDPNAALYGTKVADGFYQNAATYADSTDFYITSKEGLEYFRDLVNQVGTVADTYVTTYVNASWTAASWYTGNIFTGKTVHLMTDVDLGNVEWSPIGQPKNAAGDKRCFYGNFDGEGHKVSNLKATTYTEATKTWYAGLFGNVAGTQTFSNLTIENVTLVGYDYAGAIIGNAGSNATAFNNCHVTGKIDIKCTMVGAFVGGIVGIGTSAIDDCSVEGNTGSTIQGSTVGGLAGTSTRTAIETAKTVTDSTVTGVTVKSDDNGGQAGGLVGKATNPVSVTGNTVHDVTVSAEAGKADVLVGGVGGDVTASSNTTDTNVTVVSDPITGSGTQADPYIIANIDALKAFRDRVNAGNNYSGKYIKLTADIDLNNEEWEPIGGPQFWTKVFKGNFDGDGHTVSNLKVVKTASGSYAGFFGHLEGGSIRNLTIHNADVSGVDNCGAVVGLPYTGTVDNCKVTGLIKITASGYDVGGIGGGYYGIYGTISNCEVSGAEGSSIYGKNAGGIAGYLGEGKNRGGGKIISCKVDGVRIGAPNGSNVAGIIGMPQYGTTISNCTVGASTVIVSSGNDSTRCGLIAGRDLSSAANGPVLLVDNNVEEGAVAKLSDETPVKVQMAAHAEGATAYAIVGKDIVYDSSKKIIGGQFEQAPESALADGYILSEPNAQGLYTVEKEPVAQIGETKYTSLAAAVEAVPENGAEATTVKMIADAELDATVTIPANKNVVLDLNGKTVSGAVNTAKNCALVENSGTLRIFDSSSGGQIVNTATGTTSDKWHGISNAGTLVIEGGAFSTASAGGYVVRTVTGGTTTIEGMSVTGSTMKGVFQTAGGTLIVNDADIDVSCDYYVFDVRGDGGTPATGGSATVNGGSFKLTHANGQQMLNFAMDEGGDNTLTINGGDFTFVNESYPTKELLVFNDITSAVGKYALKIAGGTFKGPSENWNLLWLHSQTVETFVAKGGSAVISGGNFYTNPQNETSEYNWPARGVILADGCSYSGPLTDDDNNTYYTIKGAGYGGEALPAAPVFAGDTITVTPQNIQYTLDGAYGSIDGKTIVLSEGAYPMLYFARATKYPASGTEYYKEQGETRYETIEDIQTHRNEWGTCHYNRTMQNVTLKPADGATVTIAGAECKSGHVYGPNQYDYLLDYGHGSEDEGSMYYLSQTVSNITFDGLTFTGKVNFATSASGDGYGAWHTTIAGVTFDGCTFTGSGTASSVGPALRYYSEAATGYVSGLTVTDCTFENWYQGVYCNGVKDITVTGSEFDTTGHNAIAVQTQAAADAGEIVITGNTFKNIGDRVIRFGSFATGTEITITGNTATNSGRSGEVIAAVELASGVTVETASNTWDSGAKSGNPEFGAAGIGNTYYMSIADAIAVANAQNIDEITILDGTSESPDAAWKVSDGKLVRKTYVAQIGSTKYETLADAISAAQAGDTVQLLRDVNLNGNPAVINKSLTLDGDGHSLSTTTSANAINVQTTAAVKIKDLTIPQASRGLGINTHIADPNRGEFHVTVTNVQMVVAQRGITFNAGGTEGSELNVVGCEFRLAGTGDGTPYKNDQHYRGISAWNSPGATFNITDCKIDGFAYDINVAGASGLSTFNIVRTECSGRAMLNVWSSGNTFNVTDCEINGYNWQTGPTEAFGCIVDNEDSQNNTYNINQCRFTANLSQAANSAGGNASQQMFVFRGSGSTVAIRGNTVSYEASIGAEPTDPSGRFGFEVYESHILDNNFYLDTAATNDLETVLAELTTVVPLAVTEGVDGAPVTGVKLVAPVASFVVFPEGERKFATFADAIAAANEAEIDIITILDGTTTSPDSNWKVENGLLVRKVYVAQIGAVKYESLAEAVTAATAGATIEIIADDAVSLTGGANAEITINKALTITGAVDESGEPLYTIYGTYDATGSNDIFVTGSGNVTISKVKFAEFGNEKAATDPGSAPIYVSTGYTGEITLDTVTISDFNRGGIFLYGGSFVVTNCYIDCAKDIGSALTKGIEIKGTASGTIVDTLICNMERDSSSSSAGIEIYSNGNIVVDNVTIISDVDDHTTTKATYGIVVNHVGEHDPSGGNLLVTNCSFSCSNGCLAISDGDEGNVLNYSAMVVDCSFDNYVLLSSSGSTITINGGDYAEDLWVDNGAITVLDGEFGNFAPYTEGTGTIAISGGFFDRVVPEKYCAENYMPTTTPDENDMYTVVLKGVAKIGDTYYQTFAEAIAVADATLAETGVDPVIMVVDANAEQANPDWKIDGDKLVRKVYVAQINSTKFETLADAIAAARGGDTILLLSDITVDAVVTVDKTLTLDLNGYTVTNDVTGGRPFTVVTTEYEEEWVYDEETGDGIGITNVTGVTTLTVNANGGSMVIPEGSANHYGFFLMEGDYTGLVLNGGTYTGDTGSGAFIKYGAKYSEENVGAYQRVVLNDVSMTTDMPFMNYGTTYYLGTLLVNGGTYSQHNAAKYSSSGYLYSAFQVGSYGYDAVNPNGVDYGIVFTNVTINSEGGACVNVMGDPTIALFAAGNQFTVGQSDTSFNAWANGPIAVQSNALAVIEDGTYIGNGLYGITTANSGANVEIRGGTIYGKTYGIRMYGGDNYYKDYIGLDIGHNLGYAYTTLTVTGGTITSDGCGIYVLEDNDGYGGPNIVSISGGSVTGGITIVNRRATASDATVEISGGQVVGALEDKSPSGKTGVYAVSGGYFDDKVPVGYCAANYIPTTRPNGSGMYTVVLPATVTYTLGEEYPAGAALPSPASFAYPSGDMAEIALAVATCTADGYTFAGWKVGGEGDAISTLPAGTTGDITLVATWTGAQKVTITESEESAEITVTDAWIGQNVTIPEDATPEETKTAIETALNTKDENGLKKWENYVLGLDGSDPNAKLAADAAQGPVSATPITSNVDVPPVDTGFKVEYKLVASDTNGTTIAESALQSTPDLTADIAAMTSAGTNVVYYKTVAVITSTDPNKDVAVTVESTNTIGVLKVESGAKTTAVAVPWASYDGTNDISVADIVRTANLTPGDELMAYAPDGSGYKAWELDANKVWQPVTVAGGSSETEADAYTVKRGSAVWLKRADPSQPIYLVGGVAATEKAEVPLEEGSAESPSWNLVGSAGTEPVNVNEIGAATTDKIIVPTATVPKNYEYNTKKGEWGYWDYKTVIKPSGRKTVEKVWKSASVETIPAGTGFWYLNGGDSKDINL